MKILFMTEYGEGLPLALHCKIKKADVKMYIEKDINVGTGLVDITKDWLEEAKESDFAVITSSNLYKYYKMINKWTPTIGGNKIEYQLNTDPNLWKTLFRLGDGKLDVPKDKTTQYVIGAWHGKGGFRLPAVLAKVERGLLTNGKGINVDGTGICVISDVRGSLWEKFLKPFKEPLKRHHYIGFISMLIGFDNKELYPLAFKAGLDSFLIPPIKEITKARLPYFLQSLTRKDPISSNITPYYGIAINISIPPYPYTNVKVHQVSLNGYCEENSGHIWLVDANKENGAIKCAGNTGALGYATARGISMNIAKKRVNRTISSLDIPHLQYRNGIGNEFIAGIKKINRVYPFMR